jgi:hypothetical protein
MTKMAKIDAVDEKILRRPGTSTCRSLVEMKVFEGRRVEEV